MNQPHFSRSLIILLFILVAATFFVGTLRTFASAHAATVLNDLTQKADLPSADKNLSPTSTPTAGFPSPGPTPTPPPTSLLPPPTTDATSMRTPAPTLTLTSTPIPKQNYGDTIGITALAILLVVVILVGVTWGGLSSRKEKGLKK